MRRTGRPRHRRPFPIDHLKLTVDEETGHATEIRRDHPATGESITLATADVDTGLVTAVHPEWDRAMRDPTRRHSSRNLPL